MNSYNLEKIFPTKERMKILEGIIYSTERIEVNSTAKRLGLSKGLVSKYFEILCKAGMIKRKEKGFFVCNNHVVRGIRIMLNVLAIPKMFGKYNFVKAVGLYGSSSKGTNTVDSDVDLWVKVDKAKKEELVKLTSELSGKVENINLLILNDEKIKELKKFDSSFYHSLYFGSVIIYGSEDEI
jgi:predicted nucleotidyltransferase